MSTLFASYSKPFFRKLYHNNFMEWCAISRRNSIISFSCCRNCSALRRTIDSSKSNRSNYRNFSALYSFAAAVSFAKVLKIIGIEENKEVKKLISKAKQHLEDGEIDEATDIFNDALLIAIDTKDDDDVYFIKEQLAVIAFFLKKYADAEKLFLEVKNHFVQKGLQIDDLKVAYINLKLAELYDFLKNNEKAEEYYKQCSKGLKKKIIDALHNNDVEVIELWIMSLTSKAHFFLNRGNFEKAYKYFKKAHEACVHVEGELSEQAVTLLQKLGVVCFQKGDLEEAVDYLKKANELGKHLPGMVQLSNVHITLGNIYLKQGFFKEAQALCTEGYKNAVRHEYESGIKEASACLDELKRVTSLS